MVSCGVRYAAGGHWAMRAPRRRHLNEPSDASCVCDFLQQKVFDLARRRLHHQPIAVGPAPHVPYQEGSDRAPGSEGCNRSCNALQKDMTEWISFVTLVKWRVGVREATGRGGSAAAGGAGGGACVGVCLRARAVRVLASASALVHAF